MSALAIDTNVYASFLRNEATAVLALEAAHQIYLPLFVIAELLAGFAWGTRTASNREALARFMASPRVLILKPTERTADQYADIYAALRRQGTPIPTNDLWIAALARQHRLPLFSFDQHFAAVPGLALYSGPPPTSAL